MNRKPSLSDALRGIGAKAAAVSPVQSSAEKDSDGGILDPRRPPSRQGKKAITGHFDPAVSRQLRTIGLEQDRTVQDLLREALNGLFEKYGRPPIA